MTRVEALQWWRQGYEAGLAAGERQRKDHALALHQVAVAEFQAERCADRQAAVDALVLEAIDVLSRAMLGDDWRNVDRRAQPDDRIDQSAKVA